MKTRLNRKEKVGRAEPVRVVIRIVDETTMAAATDTVPAPETGHRVAPPGLWPWLPRVSNQTLARQAFCLDCGQVRSDGKNRPLSLGGLMNLLGRFYRLLARQGHPVSQAQRRLVASRLKTMGADDAFAHSRQTQLRDVAAIVSRVVGLGRAAAESYLRSC